MSRKIETIDDCISLFGDTLLTFHVYGTDGYRFRCTLSDGQDVTRIICETLQPHYGFVWDEAERDGRIDLRDPSRTTPVALIYSAVATLNRVTNWKSKCGYAAIAAVETTPKRSEILEKANDLIRKWEEEGRTRESLAAEFAEMLGVSLEPKEAS